MDLASYRRVLGVPGVPRLLLLGAAVRVPMFAGLLVLTLHVTGPLQGSYAQAGVAGFVVTAAMAAGAPWRGRVLDRVGLRRTLNPSLVVMTVGWAAAPFVDYLPMLVLVGLAGLLNAPVMAVIRQAILTLTPAPMRRGALAMDSLSIELSFMIGPLAGVWAATRWPTGWVLLGVQMLLVLGVAAVWLLDPPMRSDTPADQDSPPRVTPARSRPGRLPAAAVVACVIAAAATLVLTGTELGLVAGLREAGHPEHLGWVMSIWGLGSAVGGLVYGALPRPLPAGLLLVALAAVTAPLAWAGTIWTISLLCLIAGLLCAPTLIATLDQLSQVAPEDSRGEALGWHSSFLTAGSAAGGPVAGIAIDAGGSARGFLLVAALGMLVGAVSLGSGSLTRHRAWRRRRRRVPDRADAPDPAGAITRR
ncbi:MAG TPA: MFS transporter [Dermatophilaceae bacterium]|nr:MFS transporter [Dermatophilaceae bacterium]